MIPTGNRHELGAELLRPLSIKVVLGLSRDTVNTLQLKKAVSMDVGPPPPPHSSTAAGQAFYSFAVVAVIDLSLGPSEHHFPRSVSLA